MLLSYALLHRTNKAFSSHILRDKRRQSAENAHIWRLIVVGDLLMARYMRVSPGLLPRLQGYLLYCPQSVQTGWDLQADGVCTGLVRRWLWLQILIGGVMLLYFLERVLLSTQNPVYIPSVILIGAFLVPVVFVTYLYEHMPDWDVPLSALAACFVWGGAIGTVVAGALEFRVLLSLGVGSLLAVGLIEESAKLIFPLIFYFVGRYRSEADGIILGVSTAMGFAALETMGYSFVAFLQSGGDLITLDAVLFIRGLLSPAGHAAWTGLVCAVLFRERLRAGRGVLNHRVVGAFLTAVVLHALWDFFQSLAGMAIVDLLSNLLSLLVAIVSLTLLIRRVREARRTLPTEQPS